jgi:hypothetical protein
MMERVNHDQALLGTGLLLLVGSLVRNNSERSETPKIDPNPREIDLKRQTVERPIVHVEFIFVHTTPSTTTTRTRYSYLAVPLERQR